MGEFVVQNTGNPEYHGESDDGTVPRFYYAQWQNINIGSSFSLNQDTTDLVDDNVIIDTFSVEGDASLHQDSRMG